MITYVRSILSRGAELACTAVRLSRRSTGRHAAAIDWSPDWLPPTPLPELEPLPPWEPRVPRYAPPARLETEWLSRRYAELYSWSAEMERRIYGATASVSYGF